MAPGAATETEPLLRCREDGMLLSVGVEDIGDKLSPEFVYGSVKANRTFVSQVRVLRVYTVWVGPAYGEGSCQTASMTQGCGQ